MGLVSTRPSSGVTPRRRSGHVYEAAQCGKPIGVGLLQTSTARERYGADPPVGRPAPREGVPHNHPFCRHRPRHMATTNHASSEMRCSAHGGYTYICRRRPRVGGCGGKVVARSVAPPRVEGDLCGRAAVRTGSFGASRPGPQSLQRSAPVDRQAVDGCSRRIVHLSGGRGFARARRWFECDDVARSRGTPGTRYGTPERGEGSEGGSCFASGAGAGSVDAAPCRADVGGGVVPVVRL